MRFFPGATPSLCRRRLPSPGRPVAPRTSSMQRPHLFLSQRLGADEQGQSCCFRARQCAQQRRAVGRRATTSRPVELYSLSSSSPEQLLDSLATPPQALHPAPRRSIALNASTRMVAMPKRAEGEDLRLLPPVATASIWSTPRMSADATLRLSRASGVFDVDDPDAVSIADIAESSSPFGTQEGHRTATGTTQRSLQYALGTTATAAFGYLAASVPGGPATDHGQLMNDVADEQF